jgi:hypothetical protein
MRWTICNKQGASSTLKDPSGHTASYPLTKHSAKDVLL